jgi:hypothetical protein
MEAGMARKCSFWALLFFIICAGPALAGPEDGGCNGRDCDRHGAYSILHYWWPELYRARAHIHPSSLDQYPPGPAPGVVPEYMYFRYRCPYIAPMPTSPYADPASYYGRGQTAPR